MQSVPGAVAEADREIQAFAGNVDAVVVGEQAQVDEGMAVLEIPQAWQQPSQGERTHGADGQHFAPVAMLELLQHAAEARERIAQRRDQGQSFIGDDQPLGGAPEQARTKTVFERLDLMADGGRRHGQFLGG